MNTILKNFYIVLSIFLTNLITVECLKCYRCTSTEAVKDPYQCNEYFDDSELKPQLCDDVYNAQYCIKQIGRFEGSGLKCSQCDSALDISCTELLISDGALEQEVCDKIFEAQFCIKITGGLGTKRFCSSADLGNYCNYVQQPGDQMKYRSCYFTCTGDGCNSAFTLRPFQYLLLVPILVIYYPTSCQNV